MLVNRETVERYLNQKIMKAVFNTDIRENLCSYAYTKYNFNKGDFSDYILTRKSIVEATTFELFVMCDSFDHVLNLKSVKQYFADKEIEVFSVAKFEENKLQFPLVFKVVQVADDQWIGRISVTDLLKLKNAQIINYDPNTQRAMRRVVRGENELYKITINKKAVEAIKTSMLEGSFIPNAITLNLPENEGDYSYDENKCEFYIYSIDHLNINDGYHRYIAMSKAKDINKDFDMNMELRITTFDVPKSQRFIFQEDQKTRMSKAEANSYNAYAPENIITNKLNEDPLCNLRGLISRSGEGIINFVDFASLVKLFYYSDKEVQANDRIYMLDTKAKLVSAWNTITELNPSYLKNRFDYKELFVAFAVIKYCTAERSYIKCIDYVKQNPVYKSISARNVRKKLLMELEYLIRKAE